MIGDNVTVTVLEVRGDVVRIGIDAPRSVAVNRAELLAELETMTVEEAAAFVRAMLPTMKESAS